MRCWAALSCLVVWLECSPVRDSTPQRVPEADAGAAILESLCGHEGEACCSAPLRECAFGNRCNATSGRCEAGTDARVLVRLCRDDSECITGETCCQSGILGTCISLDEGAECPRPDLTLGSYLDLPEIYTARIPADSCDAECVIPGRHRLLRVSPPTALNLAAAELLVGGPGAPGVQLSTAPFCDGTNAEARPYAGDLLRYELLGSDGSLYSQADAKFSPGCLSPGSQPPFDCGFMGLAPSRPSSDSLCNLLVLDGVPPGDYILRTRIDPDDRIAESDETNNQVDFPFSLGRSDTLSECSPLVGIESGTDRECGWTPSATAVCVPGEEVALGCPGCQGDPILRVCPGSEVCVSGDSIAFGDDTVIGRDVSCPAVRFTCPSQGRYSAFVNSFNPNPDEATQCNVTAISASADAGFSADAGARP
jgi:hypothetical protein